MSEAQPPYVRIGDVERQRATDRLRDAYGQGALDLDELDERLERLHVLRTRGELDRLLVDLPAPAGEVAAVPPHERGALAGVGDGVAATTAVLSTIAGVVAVGAIVIVLILNAVGADSVSIFGSTTLRPDTDAEQVQVLNVFGSTEVVVPGDVAVDPGVTAIFGSTECDTACGTTGPGLRVEGLSIFGSVEIIQGE